MNSGPILVSTVSLLRSCDAADDVDDDDVTQSTSGRDVQCLCAVGRLAAPVTGRGLILGSFRSLVRSEACS